MKKNKFIKVVFAFVLGITLLLSNINASALTKDDLKDTMYFILSRKLNNRDNIVMLNQWGGDVYGSSYKKASFNANGNNSFLAFCMNHAKTAPYTDSGKNVLKKRDLNQNEINKKASIIYILENGLSGNWSLGGNYTEDEKYYITQLALWGVLGPVKDASGVEQGFNFSDIPVQKAAKREEIRKAALKLYNDALLQKSESTGTITITPKSSELKLTADGKYYKSELYKVSGNNFTQYNVTIVNAPNDLEIVNPQGDKVIKNGSLVDAGTHFYLRIKANSAKSAITDGQIKISATSVTKDLAVYVPITEQTNRQNVGIPYNVSTPISATAKFTLSPTGSLSIRKVEKKSDGTIVDIKEAQIVVKDSSGKEVLKWTSDGNPVVKDNLPIGTYTVEETVPPEGYHKVSPFTVTVKPGKITSVELENSKEEHIEISKQDATTGAELKGAHIRLETSMGKLIEEWDSTEEPHMVKAVLDPAYPEYCLVETIAPEGYLKKTTKQCFKINSKGGVDDKVVMVNEPLKKIKISKKDATTGNELPGAKLTLTNLDTGEEIETWISKSKPHYVTLEPGNYRLTEVLPPDGYELGEGFIDFVVNEKGTVDKPVEMKNSAIPVTADIPVVLIVVGVICAVGISVFSMVKLSKQEA